MEKLGRFTGLGYIGISILLFVIVDPLINDILPIFLVSRQFTVEEFLASRIFWISIFLTLVLSIRFIRQVYYDTIDRMAPFFEGDIEKIKSEFIETRTKWYFTLLLIFFYIAWTFSNLHYAHTNPEIVGQSSMMYKIPSAGIPLIIAYGLWGILVSSFIIGEAAAAVISILKLPNKLDLDNLEKYVHPIEPYRCGGMHPIGQLYFYMVGLYFVLISLNSASQWMMEGRIGIDIRTIFFLISFVIWWTIGICIFIYSQLVIHKRMVKTKFRLLENAVNELNRLESIVESDVQQRVYIEQKKMSIITYFNEYEKMKEYPLDVSTLKSIVVLALLPILVNVIGFILVRVLF